MKPIFFKFYESCIPVIGVNRAVIYDLIRGNLYFLPKHILSEFVNYSEYEIDKFYFDFKESSSTLKKYFNYLLENELIFYTEYPKRFPKLNTEIIKPYPVDVLFLEIDDLDLVIHKMLDVEIINTLGISNVVLVSQKNSYEKLIFILEMLENSKVTNITLLIKYDVNIEINLKKELKNNLQIQEVIIFDSIKNYDNKNFIYVCDSLSDFLTKRINGIDDFVLNQDAYLEGISKNLYFNRKIYIDNDYNIKHGFEDSFNYGNLKKDSIENIIFSKPFSELWNITKDQIEVCKNCEFRYICPDNRIPLKRKENDYYHQTDCNYDPYKNKWK